MAHRGPAAKANKLGHTQNAEWVKVVDVPYEGASPNLPRLPRGKKWSELVVDWWEQVRSMPHCVLWTPTDWTAAIELALLKQAFWTDYMAGEMKSTMATEIRRRESLLGTTMEARRQLRIMYVKAEGEEEEEPGDGVRVETQAEAVPEGAVASVTPLHERRQRLTA